MSHSHVGSLAQQTSSSPLRRLNADKMSEEGAQEDLKHLSRLLQVPAMASAKEEPPHWDDPDSGACSSSTTPPPPPSIAASASSSTLSGSGAASMDDFEILKVLGKGAYGKVFQARKCTGRDAGTIYALKSVSKARIGNSRTDLRHTRTERDVLVRVKHPFLVRIHYAFETVHKLYFVQEFMRGGELFRLMESERLLVEPEARFYLCEIALALEYLHSLNIVYRDLKTENIMLDAEGHIKLIDFGLSKMLGSEEELTQTFCGTVEYMAPEVVMRAPGHGLPADWWSFGVFAFDLLTGRSPFHSVKGKKETKERILRGKFSVPSFVTHEAGDLIRRLLRRNAARRLGGGPDGAAEVMAHAFFSDVDWARVRRRGYDPPHVPGFRNASDPTDVSQFDPRFTSCSTRESTCKGGKGLAAATPQNGVYGCCPHAKMFGDFDYVAEDTDDDEEDPFETDSSSDDSGLKYEEGESSEEGEETSAAKNMDELCIRDHGD